MTLIEIIFYFLVIIGLTASITPLINNILLFIRDTWDKYQEWDKKRITNWMDAYHRGEGNYEYYDPDKPTWDEDLIKADYDKYDDPFYIPDDK